MAVRKLIRLYYLFFNNFAFTCLLPFCISSINVKKEKRTKFPTMTKKYTHVDCIFRASSFFNVVLLALFFIFNEAKIYAQKRRLSAHGPMIIVIIITNTIAVSMF